MNEAPHHRRRARSGVGAPGRGLAHRGRVRTREKKSAEVPCRQLEVAVETRRFLRKTGPQLRVAERENLGHGRNPQQDLAGVAINEDDTVRCLGGHGRTVERLRRAG
jgi:hypothetical protein